MQELNINGLRVQWRRKRVKNLNLSIRAADGQVRVSSPLHTSESAVRAFIAERGPWIERHRRRFQARPTAPAYQYRDGERHPFLGQEYPLQLQIGPGRPLLRCTGTVLLMRLPAAADAQRRQAVLEHWYRRQLAERVPDLLAHWQARLGVQAREWRIRRMRTRWGSCNIGAARIWLNLQLITLPPACLEYVLVHELTHLRERYHNARFYRLLDEAMPGWRQPHDYLRGLSL